MYVSKLLFHMPNSSKLYKAFFNKTKTFWGHLIWSTRYLRFLKFKAVCCRTTTLVSQAKKPKKEQEFVRPRWPYDMRPSVRAEKYMCVIVIR